jgi:glycosyltransferase involved in cell wall biosynthesis
MPRDEYEVIFVDDGSTDGTSARLDALAAEHPHVRVEHIPNSGWPGRPRNVGIEMARGEFVYFVDNDDYVDREALERLWVRAVRSDADVVVGKVVGHGKFVPRPLFARDRDDVTLEWPPLVRLLTPHKLFRRALLDQHGIRFPVGRRRLEDHVFTMHAYFHARSISILADHPCYHWVLRLDTSASYVAFDPKPYYENVREVLDLVVDHTDPGPLRDRLLANWNRGKMLGRVGGRWFLNRDPETRRTFYDEVRGLARERYGPEADEWLGGNLRVRSHLLREGTFESLSALGLWEAELRAGVTAAEPRWEEDGTFVLPFSARLVGKADRPLLFSRQGERLLWVPPGELRDGSLPERVLDMTDALSRAKVETVIRAADKTELVLPGRQSVELVVAGEDGLLTPVVSGEARIAPGMAAAGQWDVLAAVTVCGFGATSRVRSRRSAAEVSVEIGADGAVAARQVSVVAAARGQVARRLPRLARVLRRAKERRVGAAR